MLQACTGCDPRFSEEWSKRMSARLDLDDYINVIVAVYEKYLSDEDILRLIAAREAGKGGTPASIPPALVEKLTPLMPSIQSEIMGGTTQLGAKLGAEIAMEIGKEHPEYVKNVAPAK